ncbi:MAG: hypothetical protein ABJC33_00430 [Betaproteobacteria bacterium]
MSKRFPVPAFDYERFKNMDWIPPTLLTPAEQEQKLSAVRSGAGDGFGGFHVQADSRFYERFNLRGPHQHAVMCLLPQREVRLVGRSHAWAIQHALVVDSLDADRSKVLYEWKTPRPMNTRLGPDNGVTFAGDVVYVVCSHGYADYWIVNRTLVDDRRSTAEPGFGVISASDDSINDFHACNLAFNWS